MCGKMDIDIWEVIEAAKTKPFGFMPFYPGPGIGGHCIPCDPVYLSWRARAYGIEMRMVELATEINSYMPQYVVGRIGDVLNDYKKSFSASSILVLGVAYKSDVSDTRESPALEVIKLLEEKKAKIDYCDPYVKEIHIEGKKYNSVDISTAGQYDCVVITTAHKSIDYAKLLKNSKAVFDSRGILKSVKADNLYGL